MRKASDLLAKWGEMQVTYATSPHTINNIYDGIYIYVF